MNNCNIMNVNVITFETPDKFIRIMIIVESVKYITGGPFCGEIQNWYVSESG